MKINLQNKLGYNVIKHRIMKEFIIISYKLIILQLIQ
jgi:hypothetical protein